MSTFDVTARSTAVDANKAGADSFTFLPYFRSGAAAGIQGVATPPSAPARTTISIAFTLTDGRGGTEDVAQQIALRGPGDVLGIDPAQIIRRHPAPGTASASTGDLVHLEFDQPDLPWMFTPVAPVGGRLHPWLRLVVVPTSAITEEVPPAGPDLPSAVVVPARELPAAQDGWAWAHAQVSGTKLTEGTLARHLGTGAPQLNLSRLVCPRRLTANKQWTALVVPAFEAGRLAGLGQAPIDTLDWAWGATDTVTLPVYDRWEFATGDPLGFEDLARRIVGTPATPDLGRRWVDTSTPGSDLTVTGTPGPRAVRGALVAPMPDADASGRWEEASVARLRDRLAPSGGDPVVGPPIYGGAHLQRDLVPAAGQEPAWLAELNLDPAHRIAAALGAAVVRMDQEPLMAGAWSQLQNVLAANAVLRAAQFARFTSSALHSRTIAQMSAADTLQVTQRAHAHLDVDGRTAHGAVAASALPVAAGSAAMRRLTRPLGRSMRFVPLPDRAASAVAVIADGDAGTDWVVSVPGPMTTDDSGLLAQAEAGGGLTGVLDLAAGDDAADALVEIIQALPTPDDIRAFTDGPELNARLDEVLTLIALGWRLAQAQDPWPVPAVVLARFPETGLDPFDPGTTHPQSVIIDGVFTPVLEAAASRWDGRFEEFRWPTEIGPDRHALAPLWREPDPRVGETFDELRCHDLAEPVEPLRPRLDIAALDLAARLHPSLTVPRRTATRLPNLAGLLGRPLDDLDAVMAAPEFRTPLYEALDRYDREWLMPGIAAIPAPDMVTVLETNGRFVSSFLVGANHEFARELVWREYPTDGRATSLRRFWTPEPDIEPLHALRHGSLAGLADPRFDGKLVFVVRGELVRRFPHLLANVARSTNPDYPVEYASQPVRTLFRLTLSPDILLVGVDLTDAQVTASDNLSPMPPQDAHWLTLAEHVGAPRFGLDEEPEKPIGNPVQRDALSWKHWPPTNDHLPATIPKDLQVQPPRPVTSALFAWALFQKPARVGYRVASLLSETGG
ncbi:MAG: hypothetical protein QM708_14065 [Propioniciclava sp.]|uniref:hypothetical protein n=1 Tax=Propioniciclava sp. TaxID=2038686 RepID=UPI0039E6D6A0